MLLHLVDHLAREVGADVEHGHDDPAQFEAVVESGALDAFDVAQDLAKTLEGHVLALQGNEQVVGGGEVSAFYAKQLKDNIKAVTGMIEPIMILMMGTVVGFIAMAIILPIFKMSQIVK